MFSTTTIASSTMKPTPTISATSVRLLSEKPSAYIAAAVATSATLSTEATIAVADSWRRNRPMTRITRPIVTPSVSSTSCSEARVVRVRSDSSSSSTPAGSRLRRRGSSAMMRSAVSIRLAPGWRRTITPTPRSPLIQAAR